MHAYAEGYELLQKKDIVENVPGAFKAWSRGTVVRSWLLDLMVKALEENPTLDDVSDYTADSGEGRWTVEEAHQPLGADAGHLGLAVRPVRLAPAELADHAGRRGTARPVRRAPGDDDRRGRAAARRGGRRARPAPRPPGRRPRRKEKPPRSAKAAAAKGRKAAAAGPSSGAGATSSSRRGGAASPVRPRAPARRGSAPPRRAERAGARPAPHRRRLPQLRERRAAPRAGGHDARRAQRPGQDQPRRGHGLPRDPVQPPGRHRRPARAVRCRPRRSCAAPSCATAARRWSSSRSPRAGPTGPGSTGRPLTRPRDVLGTLRTVLFAPEDLALVKGDPGERRRFLDELLVARQPRWAGVRSDYDKILKQRGALLKSAAPVLRRGGRRGARPASPRAVTSRRAGVGAAHPRRLGLAPRPGRLPAALRAAAAAARPRSRTSARPTTR